MTRVTWFVIDQIFVGVSNFVAGRQLGGLRPLGNFFALQLAQSLRKLLQSTDCIMCSYVGTCRHNTLE